MSVKIPVGADANQAVQEINKVAQALDAAADAADRFNKTDLDKPAVKHVLSDLEKLNQNWHKLLSSTVGKPLASRIGSSGQDVAAPFHEIDFRQLYIDPKQAAAARSHVLSMIGQGTSYLPQTPAPLPAGATCLGSI